MKIDHLFKQQQKIETDSRIKANKESYKEAFDGKRGSKIAMVQLKQNRTSLYRMPDFTLDTPDETQPSEIILSKACEHILTQSGFAKAFHDIKDGVFANLMTRGDVFIWFGHNGQRLQFNTIFAENVYVNEEARTLRGLRSARELVFILAMSKGQFLKFYKEHKELAKGENHLPDDEIMREYGGKIPKGEYSTTTTPEKELNDVEVGYYFNLNTKEHIIFSGGKQAIIYQPKSYPYVIKNVMGEEELYIPLAHFIGIASEDSFYNYGFFDILNHLIDSRASLLTKTLDYADEVVNPLTILRGSRMEDSAKIARAIKQARAMREKGERNIIIASSDSRLESVASQSFTAEAQNMFYMLDLEMKRLGFYLDAGDQSNMLATTIKQNIESMARVITDWWVQNGEEYRFLIETSLKLLTQIISANNETQIPLPYNSDASAIPVDSQTVESVKLEKQDMKITLGQVAQMLVKPFSVTINIESGVNMSKLFVGKMLETLQTINPNSLAHAKITKSIAQAQGMNIGIEDISPQPTQTEQQ